MLYSQITFLFLVTHYLTKRFLGVGVSNILTEQAIQTVIENMKPFLRQKNYGDALEFAVLEIDFLLKGVTNISELSKSHRNNSSKNERKNDENVYSKYLPWLLLFVIFSLIASNSSDSKTKKLKASKEALDRIYDDDEISCPNCFRLYQANENLSVDNDKRRVILTCGHSFCNACYRKDLVQSDGKESRCCLLCVEPCMEAAPSDSELPTGENRHPSFDKLPEKKSNRYYDVNIVQFRINKYYNMYEDVVNKDDVETMKKEATKGPHEGRLAVLRQKKAAENKLTIELKRQKRDEAMKAGSLGSSRDEKESGSGGTSSGGAGGRW